MFATAMVCVVRFFALGHLWRGFVYDFQQYTFWAPHYQEAFPGDLWDFCGISGLHMAYFKGLMLESLQPLANSRR